MSRITSWDRGTWYDQIFHLKLYHAYIPQLRRISKYLFSICLFFRSPKSDNHDNQRQTSATPTLTGVSKACRSRTPSPPAALWLDTTTSQPTMPECSSSEPLLRRWWCFMSCQCARSTINHSSVWLQFTMSGQDRAGADYMYCQYRSQPALHAMCYSSAQVTPA